MVENGDAATLAALLPLVDILLELLASSTGDDADESVAGALIAIVLQLGEPAKVLLRAPAAVAKLVRASSRSGVTLSVLRCVTEALCLCSTGGADGACVADALRSTQAMEWLAGELGSGLDSRVTEGLELFSVIAAGSADVMEPLASGGVLDAVVALLGSQDDGGWRAWEQKGGLAEILLGL
jgi:hypothetical protein